jgi:23S rRNA (uracil1939-C5)-methyltransferase
MPPSNDKALPLSFSKGAEIDLFIEKLALGGKAVGRVDGFVVFVEHAIPGQRVRVLITRKKAQFAEGRLVKVLTQSPAYAPPFCPHFGFCGGCQWQDLAYREQLHWERVQVQESLRHLTGLSPHVILPPVPSPQERYYRNKMEFTFAPRAWLPPEDFAAGKTPSGETCALGLHAPGGFDRVFNLEHCFLQSPHTPEIVKEVRSWCRESGLPAYSTRTHRGFWRFLTLREAKRTGQSLAHLITTGQGDPAAVDRLAAHLKARYPAITTLVHSRSDKKAQVAVGEAGRVLWGPGYIEEELCGLRFRISANSFFQTNTLAAEALYEEVIHLGEFNGGETVWDLYCGAGSIGLALAARVGRVVGFELVQDAVEDAYVNCGLNGIDNCRFLAGDLKDLIREALAAPRHYPRPDAVVTDPPRAGMHPGVVQALKELAPRRIIAVSCNPATLARDLALLQEDYHIAAIRPFDLFPHTGHIECVARLERKNSVSAW